MQLTFYSHELARIQGLLPERMRVVLGTGKDEWFRPADFAAFYRRARARLVAAIEDRPVTDPYPVDHCGLCAFYERCNEQWDREDHLVRVAGIRRDQIERLGLAEISTLEALGDAPPGTTVAHMSPETFEKLHRQAALQLGARRSRMRRYELLEPIQRRGLELLPAPSAGDLFYDIEGDPFWESARGLEYLHGVTDTARSFTAIWAHDRDQERHALERILDLFHARLAAYPDMHEPCVVRKGGATGATAEPKVGSSSRRRRTRMVRGNATPIGPLRSPSQPSEIRPQVQCRNLPSRKHR